MTTSVVSRLGRAPEEGIKAPCKTSSDVNLTLAGTGQIVGGVLTGTGDRVLVRSQTLPAENGIHLVGPDAWVRASDMNAADDVANGQLVADANTGILYKLTVGSTWDPGVTPITFDLLLAPMPDSLVLTNSNAIDLTDTDVALITGANDPDTEQHLEYDYQSIQSKADATTAAPLFLNPLGSYTQAAQLIAGDPGVEAAGIIVNGALYTSAHKVSDIGGANVAQMILHRHSTTLPPVIIAARSLSDDSSHTPVVDTDVLFDFYAAGWDGDDYAIAAQMRVVVDGTPGDGDMPGRWEFATSPDGSNVPVVRLQIFPDGTVNVPTALTVGGVAVDVDGHTHVAADISDFDTEVSNNPDVAANSAKVSNIPTALAIGTHNAATLAIDSDGSTGDVVLPSFTDTLAGLAPGSGGGTANFLRADGTWNVPPGATPFTAVVEDTTSRTAVAFEAIFVDDDTAGSTVTITLPAGSTDDQIIVKKLGTTANVIIDGDSAETIDGAATYTLTVQYESVTLFWNGSEWSIV